ncbi:MAG: hypothetical protein ABR985_22200 [Methanotrichaceae archaeon]|jgi:hypothetical protein
MISLEDAIKEVAGFDVPEDIEKRLLHLGLLLNADTDILRDLNDFWLNRFRNVVSVEKGLAACYYHFDNISSIENAVISQALDKAVGNKSKSHIFAINIEKTERLDFEYQAFILSLRRTVEYLAISISAFFKREVYSIRRLSDAIKESKPIEIREKLILVLDETLKNMPELVSPKGGRSALRDTIAHKFPIGAGELNIFYLPDGKITVSFVGSGSKIYPWEPKRERELISEQKGIGVILITPTLKALLYTVESLIFELYNQIGFNA